MSWLSRSRAATSYRRLGPLRFFGGIAAVIAWIGVGTWLRVSLHWPDGYGFHCHGKGCLFTDLAHSSALITHGHGSLKEVAEFLWIWSLPAFGLAYLIGPLLKSRSENTISITDSTE